MEIRSEWTKTFEGWRKLLRKIITKDIPDEDIEWMAQEIAISEHGLPNEQDVAEKTVEQVYAEMGKVPMEQSIREDKELQEKLGMIEYLRQYRALAMKNMAKHGYVVPKEK